MSCLSGYDSEVVGCDCVSEDKRPTRTNSSQTSEFSDCGMGSQTNLSKDMGCMARPEDLYVVNDSQKEYPPPGLNEFLRKVVPAVLDQLDQNDKEFIDNSSDSDEEEVITAKLLQELKLKNGIGSGDHESSILGVSWSSSGNSFAVSIGQMHHETWCQNPGVIKIFTLKRSEDRFVHSIDVTENNCVTALKYHPTVAALLAYGTTSGEVVICNLRNGSLDDSTLTSPAGCHGSRRVSALQWADTPLANTFLVMQVNSKRKRRGAADQVLFSSGSDGTLNVWQVNPNQKVFENIVCYKINGSQKLAAPDLTCFDFIKSYPLRPTDEKTQDDVFIVGSRSGKLYLCKIISELDNVDPVYEVLEGHGTCVLDVAFSFQKPGIFVSISMDSELRVYDINQPSNPLKVVYLDIPISCMCWLSNPCVLLGLAECDELLRVYNVCSGRVVPVSGLAGNAAITCVDINQCGSCRIAAGDSQGTLRLWDLPSRRIKLTTDDLEF